MRDLNHDLKRLQAAHDDGSHGTRAARSYALAQIADTLHDLVFKGLRATALKRKHVAALVRDWKRQVQSVHQVAHMVRQVTPRQPLPQARGQQQRLVRLAWAKRRRHRTTPNQQSAYYPILFLRRRLLACRAG